MKVNVEACWSGSDRYCFRLTLADGRRYSVSGDTWNRKTASEARSVLACETGKPRESFRFKVK